MPNTEFESINKDIFMKKSRHCFESTVHSIHTAKILIVCSLKKKSSSSRYCTL